MKTISAFERQKKIYIEGIAGKKPQIPFNSKKLRKEAKKRMAPKTWAYIDGGAGDEETISRNRSAFSKVAIVPRFMRDNTKANFSTTLLGQNLDFPFLLAPIGALDMICKDADLKIAEACANTGTPFIFSNQAGNPMEECGRKMGDIPHWFQLYWSKSDELVLSLVKRAEQSGCKAIVITIDTTLLGWRSRDLSLGYLPFLKGYGIAQYTSDPVFRKYVAEGWNGGEGVQMSPKITFETLKHIFKLKRNVRGSLKQAMKAVQLFTRIYTNPELDWKKVSWLKKNTELPILIKGILHPEDAILAREAGADGIVVSNHGGRQVNGAVSALEMLPKIREQLSKDFPVLMDSGIRNGSDVFKAIALGADAVLLGRPYAYGLAINRQKGVADVIWNLKNDFELTARLAGCRNLAEITPDSLRKDSRVGLES